jgi:hypothetical protein
MTDEDYVKTLEQYKVHLQTIGKVIPGILLDALALANVLADISTRNEKATWDEEVDPAATELREASDMITALVNRVRDLEKQLQAR